MLEAVIKALVERLSKLGGGLQSMALPLAILVVGLAIAAAILFLRRDTLPEGIRDLAGRVSGWLGWSAALAILVLAVAALSPVAVVADSALALRDMAETTQGESPTAPPVFQQGPVVATLAERTYSRSLALPPEFLDRLGEAGVEALTRYLGTPNVTDIRSLNDTFQRRGQSVVLTRDVTRLEETPIPFDSGEVDVRFTTQGIAGGPSGLYRAKFTGTYVFQNPTDQPAQVRLSFALPISGGTLTGARVSVGGPASEQVITEPDERGLYTWMGSLAPGERRTAVLTYETLGGNTWVYDLSSGRRQVRKFRLTAQTDVPIRFGRADLIPTSQSANQVTWNLENAVTQQRIALSFPTGNETREPFVQALRSLPGSVGLFLPCLLLAASVWRQRLAPWKVALGLATFAGLLLGATILAGYLPFAASVMIAAVLAAVVGGGLIAPWAVPAVVPAAALPMVMLSPTHSGLLAAGIGGLWLGVLAWRRT